MSEGMREGLEMQGAKVVSLVFDGIYFDSAKIDLGGESFAE